jgi:hypothetical protein
MSEYAFGPGTRGKDTRGLTWSHSQFVADFVVDREHAEFAGLDWARWGVPAKPA